MEIEIENNEIEVKMETEECPFCENIVPLGTLSEHIKECPEKPSEKIVIKEKTIIKEVPVRPFPIPEPQREPSRNRIYTTNGYHDISRSRRVDVYVRKNNDRYF